ncbi:unnamed protein product [Pleuronectes platessa]|uniref:Uncharacterized protein n=1 Tax=Pleuronectes platessa TaxID=8262 RepID=A0A9N7TQT7_PLEPL|nr:unnamed protein product [Pleuronectes platessa]
MFHTEAPVRAASSSSGCEPEEPSPTCEQQLSPHQNQNHRHGDEPSSSDRNNQQERLQLLSLLFRPALSTSGPPPDTLPSPPSGVLQRPERRRKSRCAAAAAPGGRGGRGGCFHVSVDQVVKMKRGRGGDKAWWRRKRRERRTSPEHLYSSSH